ncbi:MAG: hypothetical protein MRQ09_01605 [Candidatus Midichloria sp.]|nr:hypothetical protein [Candidatus Midichloria sp.]
MSQYSQIKRELEKSPSLTILFNRQRQLNDLAKVLEERHNQEVKKFIEVLNKIKKGEILLTLEERYKATSIIDSYRARPITLSTNHQKIMEALNEVKKP